VCVCVCVCVCGKLDTGKQEGFQGQRTVLVLPSRPMSSVEDLFHDGDILQVESLFGSFSGSLFVSLGP
jgi:hypothetical protein